MAETADEIADRKVAAITAELMAAPRMTVVFEPASVFRLVSLVQLALRHPGVTGLTRTQGRIFIDAVCNHFAGSPETLGLIQRGNDPANDS